MFDAVKREIGDRCLALEIFFKSACKPGFSRTPLTAKGLAFIQMYSVYEYTVINSVKAAVLEIKGSAIPIGGLRWELLGLVLDDDWKSIRDTGSERTWKRRVALLQRVNCPDAVDASDDTFPLDGSHFRTPQLETIWQLFGITESIVPHGKSHQLIEEMVEHRNAVAHGRDTPESVGRRYSPQEVLDKISGCRDLCLHIAGVLENHCTNAANLKR